VTVVATRLKCDRCGEEFEALPTEMYTDYVSTVEIKGAEPTWEHWCGLCVASYKRWRQGKEVRESQGDTIHWVDSIPTPKSGG
jgi:hypothetical protein